MKKVDSVKVRMYNTGSVGDCILYMFQKAGKTTFSMLIDCGAWNGDTADITKCAEDIRDTCKKKLDLLVVTHQHLDHVSGFNQAKKVFDEIEVNQVWMSWIEDKDDDIAKILKKKYGKALTMARKIVAEAQLKMAGRTTNSEVRGFGAKLKNKALKMEEIMALLELEDGVSKIKGAAAKRPTNDDAMEYVRGKGTATEPIRYLIPGEVVTDLKGAEGMKFYILGPPRDEDMKFFKIALNDDEMYHFAATKDVSRAAARSSRKLLVSGITLEDSISPFRGQYRMDDQETKAFFKMYESPDYEWRQIETDWLESAASLALRVNNLTNNTSLAMAIEFEASGRVLLLPADAQSGNWMGWHKPEVKNALFNAGGKDTVALLNNTVFYKVGHHGSHNGTASVSGLDFVSHPDLVAIMPLVQDKVPEGWGGADNFPAKGLYKVITDKTKGRTIRTDEGIIKSARAKNLRGALSATKLKAFTQAFRDGGFYKEFTIK
jgi:beta-lactamase superfamily II metal-dependent hydrolase